MSKGRVQLKSPIKNIGIFDVIMFYLPIFIIQPYFLIVTTQRKY